VVFISAIPPWVMLKQRESFCSYWNSDEGVMLHTPSMNWICCGPVSMYSSKVTITLHLLFAFPSCSFLCGRLSSDLQHQARHLCLKDTYRISRPIRRTFFPPEKCDLNLTCVLCAEVKYYFQTYKHPYSYYTTYLSWDSEICFQIMRSGITACERLTFL
jgi:hypothetical protein